MRVNGITSLALLKLDVLTGLDEIRVCTAYSVEGRQVVDFPASLKVLDACEPIYETLPGWSESIASARTLQDLPPAARDYVRWIEAQLGVQADLIGVGPERESTIEHTNPFERPARR